VTNHIYTSFRETARAFFRAEGKVHNERIGIEEIPNSLKENSLAKTCPSRAGSSFRPVQTRNVIEFKWMASEHIIAYHTVERFDTIFLKGWCSQTLMMNELDIEVSLISYVDFSELFLCFLFNVLRLNLPFSITTAVNHKHPSM
jgi:hypothetical protein